MGKTHHDHLSGLRACWQEGKGEGGGVMGQPTAGDKAGCSPSCVMG